MLARFVACIIQAIMHASCGLGLSTVHHLFGIHKVAPSSTCPKYNCHTFGIGLLCLICSKKSSDQMKGRGGVVSLCPVTFFLQSCYFLVIGTGILCARSFPQCHSLFVNSGF